MVFTPALCTSPKLCPASSGAAAPRPRCCRAPRPGGGRCRQRALPPRAAPAPSRAPSPPRARERPGHGSGDPSPSRYSSNGTTGPSPSAPRCQWARPVPACWAACAGTGRAVPAPAGTAAAGGWKAAGWQSPAGWSAGSPPGPGAACWAAPADPGGTPAAVPAG